MRRPLVLLIFSCFFASALAWGNQVSIEAFPPSVVSTVPQCGDNAVDAAATKRISVRFSKEMTPGSWSWAKISDESFPKIVGKPEFQTDGVTCVANVELQPGKTYAIWFNYGNMKGFKDMSGNPAVPYLLIFKTK